MMVLHGRAAPIAMECRLREYAANLKVEGAAHMKPVVSL